MNPSDSSPAQASHDLAPPEVPERTTSHGTPPDHDYRGLNAASIESTVATLQTRIEERFPGSGLSRVATELLLVASESSERCQQIARPQIGLRLMVGISALLLVAGVAALPFEARAPGPLTLDELVQVTEAGVNVLVLAAGAIFFLVTTERRIKRGRVMNSLEELRALAHVIDMHQLTKDPYRALAGKQYQPTRSSPTGRFTPFQLFRYLDYCSEMFSLIGKLAALYSQQISDPTIVAASNDIETLTTGLSRKVWQKIMILESAGQCIQPDQDRTSPGE